MVGITVLPQRPHRNNSNNNNSSNSNNNSNNNIPGACACVCACVGVCIRGRGTLVSVVWHSCVFKHLIVQSWVVLRVSLTTVAAMCIMCAHMDVCRFRQMDPSMGQGLGAFAALGNLGGAGGGYGHGQMSQMSQLGQAMGQPMSQMSQMAQMTPQGMAYNTPAFGGFPPTDGGMYNAFNTGGHAAQFSRNAVMSGKPDHVLDTPFRTYWHVSEEPCFFLTLFTLVGVECVHVSCSC